MARLDDRPLPMGISIMWNGKVEVRFSAPARRRGMGMGMGMDIASTLALTSRTRCIPPYPNPILVVSTPDHINIGSC